MSLLVPPCHERLAAFWRGLTQGWPFPKPVPSLDPRLCRWYQCWRCLKKQNMHLYVPNRTIETNIENIFIIHKHAQECGFLPRRLGSTSFQSKEVRGAQKSEFLLLFKRHSSRVSVSFTWTHDNNLWLLGCVFVQLLWMVLKWICFIAYIPNLPSITPPTIQRTLVIIQQKKSVYLFFPTLSILVFFLLLCNFPLLTLHIRR